MRPKHLKPVRVLVSLLVMLMILLAFLDIRNASESVIIQVILRLQLFPSLIRLTSLAFGIGVLGWLLVMGLSFVFGRIYCSSLCPMGTLQDIVSRLAMIFKEKKRRDFHFKANKKRLLRYGILAGTLLGWLGGSLFLLNLLDPFSNFGKIAVSLIQPLYALANNAVSALLESRDIYTVPPVPVKSLPAGVTFVSVLILMTIAGMAAFRGRLFCNSLCPAGSLLGLVSSRSMLRITFTEEACNGCARCERSCKAECIDSRSKEVDMGRCVGCFNCLSACPQSGLRYAWAHGRQNSSEPHPVAADQHKRLFFLGITAGMIRLTGRAGRAVAATGSHAGMIPSGSEHPITPPGSISQKHFSQRCTACYLCAGACPTRVIVPAFFDYGTRGFMQPKLDFHRSFCNYDCNRCGQVCPTGAITPISQEEKHHTQIGVARFYPESCVVTVDGTDCGACSEHCPTRAVDMVPYRDGLFIPQVTPELCVGCGACEFACPTEPYKAIYVESHLTHQAATPPDTGNGPLESTHDDFPF